MAQTTHTHEHNAPDPSFQRLVTGKVPTLDAQQAAARKREREEARARAAVAYRSCLASGGSEDEARERARYAAAGFTDSTCAMSPRSVKARGATGNNSCAGPFDSDPRHYIVPVLRAGYAYNARRPSAPDSYWHQEMVDQTLCNEAEYVTTRKIDGTECYVFRVPASMVKHGKRYFAEVKFMAQRHLPFHRDENDAIEAVYPLPPAVCTYDGTQPAYQWTRVTPQDCR
jgi:hypothetical protein